MVNEMDMTMVSSDLVYLMYMQLFCLGIGVMSGAISVLFSYIFVEYMYSKIKGE